MARQNLTRRLEYAQKKCFDVAFFEQVKYTDLTYDFNTGSVFCIMPSHCLLVHAGVIEVSPANVGANCTITVGSDTIVTNGAIDASAIITPAPVHSDLGGELIIKAGSVPPTQGEWEFYFLFIEHRKNKGEYFQFSDN